MAKISIPIRYYARWVTAPSTGQDNVAGFVKFMFPAVIRLGTRRSSRRCERRERLSFDFSRDYLENDAAANGGPFSALVQKVFAERRVCSRTRPSASRWRALSTSWLRSSSKPRDCNPTTKSTKGLCNKQSFAATSWHRLCSACRRRHFGRRKEFEAYRIWKIGAGDGGISVPTRVRGFPTPGSISSTRITKLSSFFIFVGKRQGGRKQLGF